MNILLLHLPFNENNFYKKGYFSGGTQSPLFPIGLSYIAKKLVENKYPVKVVDIYAEQLCFDKVVQRLEKIDSDIIGIAALVPQDKYLKWITKEIKKINKNCKIVLGSGLGTACDKIVLDNIKEVDICVRGEGEITFLELLENNFKNLESIDGISYRAETNGVEIIRNKNRKLIEDIDALGFPLYKLFDIELYLRAKFYDTGIFNTRERYKGLRAFPIITARGCPYNCNFCGKIIPGARLRSVTKIIEEIKYLKEKCQIEGVHFVDELLVINKGRAKEICAELKKLNIIWDCQGRVNLVDYEIMKTMKDAGCIAIGFGVESGDPQILKNMNKQTTPEQIEKSILGAQKAGLAVKNQLIFGYPGETCQTLENTVKLMKKVNNPGRRFNYIQPIPGTKLYGEALQKKLIIDEEYYLYNLFNTPVPQVNFTKFETDEIPKIMRYYFDKMQINYIINLITRPCGWIKLIKNYQFIKKILLIVVKHYIRILGGNYKFIKKYKTK